MEKAELPPSFPVFVTRTLVSRPIILPLPLGARSPCSCSRLLPARRACVQAPWVPWPAT